MINKDNIRGVTFKGRKARLVSKSLFGIRAKKLVLMLFYYENITVQQSLTGGSETVD